jgi:hypothetical protein
VIGFFGHSFTIITVTHKKNKRLSRTLSILTGLLLAPFWSLSVLTSFWVWIWVLCYDRRSVGQSGAYGQIFITVRQLPVCWCGALSLMRERVCRLQLLLALASAVILGSESRGTRDHILLPQIRDFFFVASYDTQSCTGSIRPTPFWSERPLI